MTEPIRLFVTDYHPVVRAGLRGMHESQLDFEVVDEGSTDVGVVEGTNRFTPEPS